MQTCSWGAEAQWWRMEGVACRCRVDWYSCTMSLHFFPGRLLVHQSVKSLTVRSLFYDVTNTTAKHSWESHCYMPKRVPKKQSFSLQGQQTSAHVNLLPRCKERLRSKTGMRASVNSCLCWERGQHSRLSYLKEIQWQSNLMSQSLSSFKFIPPNLYNNVHLWKLTLKEWKKSWLMWKKFCQRQASLCQRKTARRMEF